MKVDRIFKNGNLISLRVAVTVISLLFGFTFLGWMLTEVFPADFITSNARYAAVWGKSAVTLSLWLRLYDPFHSFWYIGVLGLFFAVLLLCVVSRAPSLAARAFRPLVPAGPSGPAGKDPVFKLGWSSVFHEGDDGHDPLAHYSRKFGKPFVIDQEARRLVLRRLSGIISRKGFRTWSREEGDTILFAARAGGWRHLGTLLFHAGLLVITAGGMVGSIWGSMEMLYGKVGDVIPLYGNRHSIRIDDFEIISTPSGEIKDYVSRLTVLDSLGRVERIARIEVNHPLEFKGFNVYQSSYYVDEGEFGRARIKYTPEGGDASVELVVKQGDQIALKDSIYVLKPGRFFPDFRLDASGPYSASHVMRNPALEMHLAADDGIETGYLLLRYPSFNSKFRRLASMILTDIEPVYYTGLEVSRNPGAPLMLAGLLVAPLGLLLMYMLNYRTVGGVIGAEDIRIWAGSGRWRASLAREISGIGKKLEGELAEYKRRDGE